jgi:hypothetical protein
MFFLTLFSHHFLPLIADGLQLEKERRYRFSENYTNEKAAT